ncbi:MAG: DUF1501 domain-containing protein [Acidobacteria bacterium]|jgi:Protein of unknown function (DUF1501)|nr:DUF1501 domain-containing protein [Acidobacteriota bacterium]
MPSSRRQFLSAGSLGFLGLNTADLLRAKPTGKAQSCILLWLEGGPSQIDTWDPKPNSAFQPISTNVPGIQISELLPQVSRRMDRLSLVRSMHTRGSDHPQGTHYAITGHEVNPAMQFPSIGAIIAKETGIRNAMPPHVLAPQWEKARQYEDYFRAGFLGPEYDPMCIPDPSKPDFQIADLSLPKSVSAAAVENRQGFLQMVDRRYRKLVDGAEHAQMDGFSAQAWKMLLNPGVREAFDLSKESEKVRDRYGRDAVGQSALMARRLVEAGTRFVTAAGFHSNSWDTHAKNDEGHRDRLCPPLDRTLSALLDDLKDRGLYDSTIVLAMGEFGRTPFVNNDRGRDHWPNCWSLAIGGGGIAGGRVVGASDAEGAQVTDRATSMGDLFATIYKAFGIDWTKEYDTPIGRPIKIANSLEDQTGNPLTELF